MKAPRLLRMFSKFLFKCKENSYSMMWLMTIPAIAIPKVAVM